MTKKRHGVGPHEVYLLARRIRESAPGLRFRWVYLITGTFAILLAFLVMPIDPSTAIKILALGVAASSPGWLAYQGYRWLVRRRLRHLTDTEREDLLQLVADEPQATALVAPIVRSLHTESSLVVPTAAPTARGDEPTPAE